MRVSVIAKAAAVTGLALAALLFQAATLTGKIPAPVPSKLSAAAAAPLNFGWQ